MRAEDEVIGGITPRLLRRYRVPGCAIACVAEGRLSWSAGFGTADAASRRSVEVDTRFQVASVSKVLTAWAAMGLVEAGRVGLDDRADPLLKRWHFPAD